MAPPPSKAPAAAAAAPKAPKEKREDAAVKPDQKQYQTEQDGVRAEIDALQAQLVRLSLCVWHPREPTLRREGGWLSPRGLNGSRCPTPWSLPALSLLLERND